MNLMNLYTTLYRIFVSAKNNSVTFQRVFYFFQRKTGLKNIESTRAYRANA